MKKTKSMEYMHLDMTTPEGRRAFLEQFTDDLIELLEPLEPLLRDPRTADKRRLDLGVLRNLFVGYCLDPSKGYQLLRPDVKEYGSIGLLLGAAETMANVDQLRDLWQALDDVRARRDARRTNTNGSSRPALAGNGGADVRARK